MIKIKGSEIEAGTVGVYFYETNIGDTELKTKNKVTLYRSVSSCTVIVRKVVLLN
jgi:hypothetical protein